MVSSYLAAMRRANRHSSSGTCLVSLLGDAGHTLGPRSFWPLLVGLILLLAVGCSAPPPIYFGRPIPVDGLDKLVSEQSSAAEVRAALGKPRGYGMTRHTPNLPIWHIWFYDYNQIKGDQVGLSILLVFMHDGRYVGHYWFAAQELIEGPLVR